MQPFQGVGQALIDTGQAAKAGHPAEAALDDPAARQQPKAARGVRELDHFELNAVWRGSLGRQRPPRHFALSHPELVPPGGPPEHGLVHWPV
jgi:hypothetical protein